MRKKKKVDHFRRYNMRKLSFVFLVLIGCNGIHNNKASKSCPIDEKNGFKDIVLEECFLNYNERIKYELIDELKEYEFKTYRLLDEKYYAIGDIKLQDVNIVTLEDTILSIEIIEKQGLFLNNGLLNSLKKAYGEKKETRSNDYISCTWAGEKCLLSYSSNRIDDIFSNISATYSSKRLLNKFAKKRDDKVAENANNL